MGGEGEGVANGYYSVAKPRTSLATPSATTGIIPLISPLISLKKGGGVTLCI